MQQLEGAEQSAVSCARLDRPVVRAVLALMLLWVPASCGAESTVDVKAIGVRDEADSAAAVDPDSDDEGPTDGQSADGVPGSGEETDNRDPDVGEPDDQGSAGEPTGLAQWQQEMERICVEADRVLVGVNPFDTDALYAAAIEGMKIRHEKMSRLPRPEGHESAVEELLEVVAQIVAAYESAPDGTAVIAGLEDPDSEYGARLDELTAELGIENCGDGAESTARLCSLVPDDLVMSVLGEVPAPEARSQFGAEGCQWGDISDDIVSVHTGPLDVYARSLDLLREDGKPITGLGDEAFVVNGFSSVTGGSTRGSTVWVVVDDRIFAAGAIVDGEAVDTEILRGAAAGVMAGYG